MFASIGFSGFSFLWANRPEWVGPVGSPLARALRLAGRAQMLVLLEAHRQTHRPRQTNRPGRHTDRQTDREQPKTQREKDTCTQRRKQAERHTHRRTEKHIDKATGRDIRHTLGCIQHHPSSHLLNSTHTHTPETPQHTHKHSKRQQA